jgi:putative transposase
MNPDSDADSLPAVSVVEQVRPGVAGLVAVKRGREPAPQPGNNPEMGCESRDH